MNDFWRDVRYAIRMLSKQPAFTAIAILTLALGIGANAAIFSIVNAVFLRPLPFPNSERIYQVRRTGNQIGGSNISWPIFLAWEQNRQLFDALAGYRGDDATLVLQGDPQTVSSLDVSSEFFSVLGVQPALGRAFRPDETRLGGPNVVILSDAMWRTHFGGDPGAIGRTVPINGKIFTVIGVMSSSFSLPLPYTENAQLFLPLPVPAQSQNPSNFMRCIGLLKPGVTPAQAEAMLTPPLGELSKAFPDMIFPSEKANLRPLREYLHAAAGPVPLLLLGAVSLVLLIACANVANLVLARAAGRTREVAVRAALGASRGRILRQLLTENVILAIAGGVAGVVACYFSFNLVLALIPSNLPHIGAIAVDSHVFAFALLLSVVTGIVFGLVPALQTSKTDLQTSLKEGTARGGTSRERGRWKAVLIVSEVALAFVLLVSAALVLESLARLMHVPVGFDADRVLTIHVTLPHAQFDSPAKSLAALDGITTQFAAQPGVQEVAYASALPMDNGGDWLFSIEGRPDTKESKGDADFRTVQASYFAAFRIPVERGRVFTLADTPNSEPVVVINRAMAAMYWPGEDPIGSFIWVGKPVSAASAEPAPRRIIGVVGNVHEDALGEPPPPVMYEPYSQATVPLSAGVLSGTYFIIRTAQDPGALTAAVRSILRTALPGQPLDTARTMDQIISNSLTSERFQTTLLTLFGGLGLLIVIVGVYGVISYFVAQRTHEIGVRMALGATQTSVLRLVLRQGALLAAVGVAVGVAASLALARLLQGLLYGIAPSDPATLVGITVLLMIVVLAASWIPARRATRVDPLIALRHE